MSDEDIYDIIRTGLSIEQVTAAGEELIARYDAAKTEVEILIAERDDYSEI